MSEKYQGKRQATSQPGAQSRTFYQAIRERIVENVGRVRDLSLEWKISNHCSAAQPRHNGGPARMTSAGRAAKLNARRFCSLTAGIREHHSLSLAYISTAQEDVPCSDHNGVAPKRQ